MGGLQAPRLGLRVLMVKFFGFGLLGVDFWLYNESHLRSVVACLLIAILAFGLLFLPLIFRNQRLVVTSPVLPWMRWQIHIATDFNGALTREKIKAFEAELSSVLAILRAQNINYIRVRSHIFSKNPQLWAQKFNQSAVKVVARRKRMLPLERWLSSSDQYILRDTHMVGQIDWDYATRSGAGRFASMGAVIALAAWSAWPQFLGFEAPAQLALTWLIPLLWLMAGSRSDAFALVGFYYLVAWRDAPFAIVRFTGVSWIAALAIWVMYALVQAIIWNLAWSASFKRRCWGLIAVLVITNIPPLAAFTAPTPLISAGWLFPSIGWTGLLLTVFSWPLMALVVRDLRDRLLRGGSFRDGLFRNALGDLRSVTPCAGWMMASSKPKAWTWPYFFALRSSRCGHGWCQLGMPKAIKCRPSCLPTSGLQRI